MKNPPTDATGTAVACTARGPPAEAAESPIAIDSGIPSMSAPTAIANPLPGISDSVGCATHSPHRLRRAAPRCSSLQLIVENTNAPRRKPPAVTAVEPRLRNELER